MTNHGPFEQLAISSVDFALSAAEQAEFDRHLAGCEACRAVAAAYRADAAVLRSIAIVDAPGRVRSGVLAAAAGRRVGRPGWWLPTVAAILATLLGLAALGVGAVVRELLEPEPIGLVVPPSLPPIGPAETIGPSSSPPSPSLPAGWTAVQVPIPGVTGLRTPPGSLRSVPATAEAALRISTTTGSHVYSLGPHGLHLFDLAGGTASIVEMPLVDGEEIETVDSDGTWLLGLLVRQRKGESQGGEPCSGAGIGAIAWRLVAAPLDGSGMPSGPFRVLDEGSIGRPFRPGGTNFIWCDGPLAPVLSVAAGLAAYSRESQDPKRGEGADIVIRAIDSGAIRHTIQTDARIMALAASPRLVAWWQAANALVDGEDAPWALIRSALGSGSTERASVAGPIDPDRRVIFIDDVTVVTTGPTSERSPTVFWEEGQIRQLPAPGAADAPSACRPTGVFDGTVSMACVATDWITGSGGVDLPVLWSEELGHWIVADLIEQRTALGTHRAYDTAMLSDGWLVWGGEGSDGSEWSSEIAGVPLGGINGVP